jgi:sn-glycerol 3-phosphate transport system substrate-binding protein
MKGMRRVAGVLAACVVVAACGSGRSILDAGNDVPAATTTLPPVTAAPGSTLPPTTLPPVATTTTTPLSALAPCPVGALADVTTPVEITFWHGLGAVLEDTLTSLTNQYNSEQTKVHVTLQNQGGYKETIDKYLQSGQSSRPQMVLMPEYMVQQMADSKSVIPVGACMAAEGFDTSPFLPRGLLSYATAGVQWAMPFNISNPVLFYNMSAFEQAGLDPADPPVSLEELRSTSEQLVASGAVGTGIALDSGVDSGGGWFLEQWFARAGEPYADNGNGRLAPATKVLFDNSTGVQLLTAVQSLVQDGLAVTVGDNPNGQDALLKLADPAKPAAMAIASSAAIGTVISVLDGGLIPGITSAQLGVGPMPGPGDVASAIVGGGSLYIVSDKGDPAAAAAWDFLKFLTRAQTQSDWAAATGYVPIRQDALELEPLKSTYATDPRFKVAYDQLLAGKDDLASVGPVIGPLPQVRASTAGAVASIFGGADVQTSLTAAAQQSDALITQYNALN